MNDPQVAGHIGSRTQEIHRCLAVSRVVFILLQQSSGRDGFPLSFFIQPLIVAEDRFSCRQAFPDVALVITSAEDHHVSGKEKISPFRLNIAHIRSLLLAIPSGRVLPPSAGSAENKASFQEFIQCVAEGQLMVIKIIGDEYHLHCHPCLSAIFA